MIRAVLIFLVLVQSANALTELNSSYSPIAQENKDLLRKRLIESFDSKYKTYSSGREKINYATNYAEIYYLKRELQGLIDIWYATENEKYLWQANALVKKAINDAVLNSRVLFNSASGMKRGSRPCFFHKDLKRTGGHSQLFDIQAAIGFMLVARAMEKANLQGWEEIVAFVEDSLVDKWLWIDEKVKKNSNKSKKLIESGVIVLKYIEAARDKREQFASVCMDLAVIGKRNYPYKKWGELLSHMYLDVKESKYDLYSGNSVLEKYYPKDWGVLVNKKEGSLVWFWTKDLLVEDTSHANRTAWLAARAYDQGFLTRERLDYFINTLKKQIWKKRKKGFYFSNYIDGRDNSIGKAKPGQRGSVWFGWHRLAFYDEQLKDLFVSMAYDLTNGGAGFAEGTLNKSKRMAPMCLIAWGARLLSEDGDGSSLLLSVESSDAIL